MNITPEQWVNLILLWLFFGCIAAFVAKKRGKNPIFWFFIGFSMSLFGLALLLLLPLFEGRKSQKQVAAPPPKPRTPEWNSYWFYLDKNRAQHGPVDFLELSSVWKKQEINEDSLLWSEGMEGWKKLQELPHLSSDLRQEK